MPLTRTQLSQIADILLDYAVDKEFSAVALYKENRLLSCDLFRDEIKAREPSANTARELFAAVLYEMGGMAHE